jgi:putative flavoprotein involved in K+ transport
MERVAVAVIGGGQAGLAASRELTARGIEHLVLERGRVGQTWRDRWDSFRLVTPNWSLRLPGGEYDGPDPDGFLPREEVVAHLEGYATDIAAPVREGVAVEAVERDVDDGFVLRTSSGPVRADALVVATGAYQRPHRPAGAASLPAGLLQLDVTDYRNEGALPEGRVLVVGSGQSGCQIADELRRAGREVILACGKAPWSTRRIGDRDLFWWALETGYLDASLESLPSPAARLVGNVLLTGHGGGRDLHLRTLQDAGVVLAGRFLGASNGRVGFAPDLAETVAWGDARRGDLHNLIRKVVTERGLEMPELEEAAPFDSEAPADVPLENLGVVVFAGGFRPDYGTLLPWPEAFDELGFPLQHDGASTVVPNLYFLGVHFLRKRKSSLFVGIGEDAAVVAQSIAGAGRPDVAEVKKTGIGNV